MWTTGPEMQEPRSRFCAVTSSEKDIIIVGGETDDEPGAASGDVKALDTETGEWTLLPGIAVPRKVQVPLHSLELIPGFTEWILR